MKFYGSPNKVLQAPNLEVVSKPPFKVKAGHAIHTEECIEYFEY
jgi:hypothetical protein